MMTETSPAGMDIVINQIIRRYSNPARATFMYLFLLPLDADFSGVFPTPETVLTAWVDEGSGFQVTPADEAVRLCSGIQQLHIIDSAEHRLTSTERKQMMARTIQFSVEQKADDFIVVHLVSKAITFSPKGDREVYEHWRLGSTGWYSIHRPEGNTTED
ncbi:MAG: hypothetical protein KF716_01205 [Anaerolineae bacterium]|nr:hypothetical protein [Anaerolineae bacterium]